MMKFMINTLGKNIIFKDYDKNMKIATFCFSGPYLLFYPNKKAEKIVEVEIEIDENGIAKLDERLEELFTMRNMDGRLFECVGPYNEDDIPCYTVNVKSFPSDPIREGIILENMDWERQEKKSE